MSTDSAVAGSPPLNPPTQYTSAEKRHRVFAIMAASSGNLVEWFDFYVYAFSALYFALNFLSSCLCKLSKLISLP